MMSTKPRLFASTPYRMKPPSPTELKWTHHNFVCVMNDVVERLLPPLRLTEEDVLWLLANVAVIQPILK